MYRIQGLRIVFAITLAIAVILGATATPAAAVRNDSGGATVTARHDGEAIFSGIFFKTGPVAALLPARVFPAATADEARTLIAAINKADPTFFSRFAEDIRSGDRIVIREALSSAARMLELVVTAAYPQTLDCDPSLDPTCSSGFGTYTVILIAVVDVANVYRVVDFVQDYNVYYQYDLWRTQYFIQMVRTDQASQLESEAFIDAIARAFGA